MEKGLRLRGVGGERVEGVGERAEAEGIQARMASHLGLGLRQGVSLGPCWSLVVVPESFAPSLPKGVLPFHPQFSGR